jgi:hypothetical protein
MVLLMGQEVQVQSVGMHDDYSLDHQQIVAFVHGMWVALRQLCLVVIEPASPRQCVVTNLHGVQSRKSIFVRGWESKEHRHHLL